MQGSLTFASSSLLSLLLLQPALARDNVGDLNASYLEAGDFSGSYKVVGKSKIPVSIAVGGFIKTVMIIDTDSQREDTYFRPSLLTANDRKGNTQINANFSRWYLDGRATLDNDQGQVRGYLESDFYQGSYRLRHAFMSWGKANYQITAGQTWTTFLDVSAFPEMVYELGPAGGILLRQGQIRLSHNFRDNMQYSLALENPNSADVERLTATLSSIEKLPDVTANFRWQVDASVHLQFSALIRQLAFDDATNDINDTAMAVATHVSGAWTLDNNDKLAWSFLYGDGIGRYLIGASAYGGGNAAYIDNTNLETRTAMGGYISYKHFWSDKWRSSLVAGLSDQDKVKTTVFSNDNFESAYFVSINAFWHPNKVINTGLELSYGEADFTGMDSRDNSRIAFVIQLF